jgi:ssDNA thymidine ADP-ribosyltransferase, DarT
MAVPIPTPIYHITHYRNLSGIIAAGGLTCCAALRSEGTRYEDVANDEIQDRRATFPVPVPPHGLVHDYVPFYFAPKSPMLYVISRGGIRYPERQAPMVQLVSTAQAVYASGQQCAFTNGHAIMALSDYFTELASLDQIDWDVMQSRYWNDTADHPDRKRRRQAEFLVYHRFPWELVAEIGVSDRQTEAQVLQIIGVAAHKPLVRIRSDWFY